MRRVVLVYAENEVCVGVWDKLGVGKLLRGPWSGKQKKHNHLRLGEMLEDDA